MGLLTLGELSTLAGKAEDEEDYLDCREEHPIEDVLGPLTQEDPCWQELVAMRRAQGRDPLGRDATGMLSRYRSWEQTGVDPMDVEMEAPTVVVIEREREPLLPVRQIPIQVVAQAPSSPNWSLFGAVALGVGAMIGLFAFKPWR